MYEIYRISNDIKFKLYYKKYCKILSSVILTAQKMHFDKRLLKSTNRQKTTWNIVKNITNKGNSTNNIQPMNINTTVSSNPFTIANAFNSYFTSIAENFNFRNYLHKKNDPMSYLKSNFNQSTPPIRFTCTSTYEINKIIHSLECTDSYGYDEVSTRILRNCAPYITSPLTHIFNKGLSMGIFPDRLKFSDVKPLFKKGDKTDLSNYRPI